MDNLDPGVVMDSRAHQVNQDSQDVMELLDPLVHLVLPEALVQWDPQVPLVPREQLVLPVRLERQVPEGSKEEREAPVHVVHKVLLEELDLLVSLDGPDHLALLDLLGLLVHKEELVLQVSNYAAPHGTFPLQY